MKNFFLILISLIILSCKDTNSSLAQEEKEHIKLHVEMDKVDEEYKKFEKQLINLYAYAEKNPEKAILKADSLLLVNNREKDKYKSQIKSNIDIHLHRLKAELLYQLARYSESITELEFDDHIYGDEGAGLAANYIKLKDYKKAKSFVDNIDNYISDYSLGNYYECIGKKAEAIKIYNSIKQDKSIKHYVYYKLAVNRLEELQKNNPKFLDEIYFPTGNPSFEICDSDNENRTKVIELVRELPEVKDKFEKNAGIGIVEAPKDNGKNYYWVRFYEDNSLIFKTEYNFFIYQKTFEIKYFDKKSNKVVSLAEWRKTK